MARSAVAEASADSRERILNAALAVFSEHGFEGAKTREIAGRAGVPLGLLQYHFGGKAKLWQAAVDEAFVELKGGLEGVLVQSAGNELETLRLLIRGHVQFVARNPEFIRLLHDEGKRKGPRMRWLVDRHAKPLFETLLPLIESSQRKGILPDGIDAFHFVYILVGAVAMIFHQAEECKRITGVDPTDPSAIEAHSRAVENLFLGSPKKETA